MCRRLSAEAGRQQDITKCSLSAPPDQGVSVCMGGPMSGWSHVRSVVAMNTSAYMDVPGWEGLGDM